MDAEEKTIALFSTRVRQMILQYEEMKAKNADLLTLVEERNTMISNLEQQLAQAKKDYDSLKMARMIEVTNGDLESAQKRLSKLIRDVNKCITLISEK